MFAPLTTPKPPHALKARKAISYPLTKLIIRIFLAVCAVASATAEIRLAGIFSDHMVVQQGRPIVVWGKANAGDHILAKLAGNETQATANEAGEFRLEFPALDANDNPGPHQLILTGPENEIRIQDVLVGEVWLCSGQSNMAQVLLHTSDSQEAIERSGNPRLRIFKLPITPSETPQFGAAGAHWELSTPKSSASTSAVAYYFGRELQAKLNRPIGLIQAAVGQTPIEAWTPVQDLNLEPEAKPLMDYFAELEARDEEVQAVMARWKQEWEAAKAAAAAKGERYTRGARGLAGYSDSQRPGYLYNGMIHPVVPYPLGGVIWYQGESNVARGKQYSAILPRMIEGWRREFEHPGMPFGIIQLANYNKLATQPGESGWAAVRDAQFNAAKADPNTGLAVTIDIGDAIKIHPLNKLDVGKRIAAWALADVYGLDVVPSGPIYRSMEVQGSTICLHFDYADGGLVARDGELKGFSIAGANKEFVWGNAIIDGNTILVSSDAIQDPVAVRYAWADNPPANLYNQAGLPASPFRTDEWTGKSDGKSSHMPLSQALK